MEKVNTFFSYADVIIIGLSLCAFYVNHKVFPLIIYLSYKKNLTDQINKKKSYTKKTPNLGGIGIFISFLLCTCLSAYIPELQIFELKYLLVIVGAISILFYTGIKDDLNNLSPLKKIIGQFIAASVVIFGADLKIENLYGLFGIGELNTLTSVFVSYFVFLFFANAFNSSKGNDSLTSIQAVIGSFVLGLCFVINNQFFEAALAFVLLVCLLGFLGFNLNDGNKIGLGNCGALIVGFLLTILSVYFLKLDFNNTNIFIYNKLVLLFTLFAFPILETARLFFLKLLHKKNPFPIHKKYLDQRLIYSGLPSMNITLIIAFSNVILILITLLTGFYENVKALGLLFCIAIGLFYAPFFIISKSKKRRLGLITDV